MATGIRIINDAGTTLIDETYSNLCLHTKGSLTLNAVAGTIHNVAGTWGDTAVVAVRSSGKVFATIQAGSITIIGAASAVVTYYVFDVPTAPYSTYGLLIYNAAGDVVFDALKKYARVAAIQTGTTAAAWDGTVAYPAGRTYAYAFLVAAYKNNTTWTHVGDPAGHEYRVDVDTQWASASISGVTIDWQYGPVSHKEYINFAGGFGAYTTEKPKMTAAVVDVTGY